MNWGYKLTIGIISFMAFIVFLVVKMVTTDVKDTLIDEDYYEKGQNLNVDLERKQLAQSENFLPALIKSAEGMDILFAEPVSYQAQFRLLADENRDTTIVSSDSTRSVHVPATLLGRGSWLVRITYSRSGREYLFEEKFHLP